MDQGQSQGLHRKANVSTEASLNYCMFKMQQPSDYLGLPEVASVKLRHEGRLVLVRATLLVLDFTYNSTTPDIVLVLQVQAQRVPRVGRVDLALAQGLHGATVAGKNTMELILRYLLPCCVGVQLAQ